MADRQGRGSTRRGARSPGRCRSIPASIQLPAAAPRVERPSGCELFKYPRSLAACLTGMSQTGRSAHLVDDDAVRAGAEDNPGPRVVPGDLGGRGRRSRAAVLLLDVGRDGPPRLAACWLPVGAALPMSLAGYLNSVFIGGVSMFFLMILVQNFFGSGNYAIVGPYMAEVWPARACAPAAWASATASAISASSSVRQAWR